MGNPFVGFDIFAKQSDPDDSDNPTAESLGLTGNRTSTPDATDMGHTVPDPAAQMGQLPVRPERIATMERRKKEGKEAHPGFAQERAKALQSIPTTHRDNEWMASVLSETLGISITEAVERIAEHRKRQSEWSPYQEMSEEEAEKNLEAEAGNAFEPEGDFEYSKSVDGFVKALGFFIDSYGGKN